MKPLLAHISRTFKGSNEPLKVIKAQPSIPPDEMPAQASTPVYGNFPSEKLTIGAGVAIFHLASERVVVCYHTRDKYYFLPKGRKNANESTTRAAEREGFEESGYRNRLLPLPFKHRQPDPDEGHEDFAAEALWMQFLPLTPTSQYILFWYAAETLPEADEDSAGGEGLGRGYREPEAWPVGLTVRERVKMDGREGGVYEPRRHPGTGVDEEEMLYTSFLFPVEEACRKLKGSVMEDVVRRAWAAIQLRIKMEDGSGTT